MKDDGDVCVSVPRVRTGRGGGGVRGCPSELKASETLQYELERFFSLDTVKHAKTISLNLPSSVEREPADVVPDFTEDKEKKTERERERKKEDSS